MSIKTDLEQRIRNCEKLITHSEQAIEDSTDPTGREESRANRNITQQMGFLKKHLQQYINVCKVMGYPLDTDTIAIAMKRGIDIPPELLHGPTVQQPSPSPVQNQTGSVSPSPAQSPYAELEMSLHRSGDHYAVGMRYCPPDGTEERDPLAGQSVQLVQFDMQNHKRYRNEPHQYGEWLTQSLFATEPLRTAFAEVTANAVGMKAPLRLRLKIAHDADGLHHLRWETLRDPRKNTLLLTSERTLFSRYLTSAYPGNIGQPSRSGRRALVVIANPSDVQEYKLAEMDVVGEYQRVCDNLKDVAITTLASGIAGSAATPTLHNIIQQLRQDEGYDILYLVAHGMITTESCIFLEKEDRSADVIAGNDLTTRLGELWRLPRIAMLASCLSAGRGESQQYSAEALAALGPQMVETGIPAVLAMQGEISLETIKQFMPMFFRELQNNKPVDQAVAVARGEIRDRFDWWMPVLFMRLREGMIWEVA